MEKDEKDVRKGNRNTSSYTREHDHVGIYVYKYIRNIRRVLDSLRWVEWTRSSNVHLSHAHKKKFKRNKNLLLLTQTKLY